MMRNIGFAEALKDTTKKHSWDCFVFQDVDLLTENDHNILACSDEHPRHLSGAVDIFDYQLPYPQIFGGVVAISRRQFLLVNGYSNAYFGWGGEDDDLYERFRRQGIKINQPPMNVSRYVMLSHKESQHAPDRFRWFHGKGRQQRRAFDGVNSLRYRLVAKRQHRLFTRVVVEIDQKDIQKHLERQVAEMPWWSTLRSCYRI